MISIYLRKKSLLNYAPCVPLLLRALIIDTRLHAFTLINIRLTHLFLLYIMLLQLKAKVPLFCVCTPINHSPLPALSFLLFFRIKLFYIFIFFLLFQTVGYTIVYTIIFQQHFHIFCSIFINKHSVFTHLTHGQILLEFLQFKHRKFFQTIQYVAIISHKFLIIT